MNTGNVEQALQVNATSLRNKAATGQNGGKELGKQDFLNLLMTQMANQDPLDPMDSQGMMQQMASMGTVEQLQNLNAQTAQLMEIQQNIARATAGSLLDKDVEIGARQIPLNRGEATPVSYKLDGSADRVMVHVHDHDGSLIRKVDLESRAQGVHEFAWDGRDNDGDAMPDGNYSFNVFAKTDGGEEIGVTLTKSGQVSMVRFEGSKPMVQINGEWMPAKEIMGLGNQTKRRYENAGPLPLQTELSTRKSPDGSLQGLGAVPVDRNRSIMDD